MEPIKKKKAGRELGNAAAAALLCKKADGSPISWETYQWYVRQGKPAGNPPPGPVEIDNDTGQSMYPLKEVRAWQAARPGRGNWGGIGARARKPKESAGGGVSTIEATTVTASTIEAGAVSGGSLAATSVEAGTLEGHMTDAGTVALENEEHDE